MAEVVVGKRSKESKSVDEEPPAKKVKLAETNPEKVSLIFL